MFSRINAKAKKAASILVKEGYTKEVEALTTGFKYHLVKDNLSVSIITNNKKKTLKATAMKRYYNALYFITYEEIEVPDSIKSIIK